MDGTNGKLWYMDTDSFIVHVKTKDHGLAEDAKTRSDTSNFELDRSLPRGENRKVIGIMKDELRVQIMKEFVGLRAKTYRYLKDSHDKGIKAKGIKRCVMKKTQISKLQKLISLKEDQKEIIKKQQANIKNTTKI